MKKSLLSFLTITTAFMFVFFGDGPSSLYAQGTADEEFTLEEIVVTAEKKEENIQKIPISMAIVSSEDINAKGLSTVDSMLRTVAGLEILNREAQTTITIRGIGSTGDGVALNVDGIAMQNGRAASASMMDVERIEVLRGPQGTLYGRNAIGGVVNVITSNPKDYFEASGKVTIGNYNLRTYEVMVNVPVGDKFSFRLTGQQDSQDGFIHPAPGQTETNNNYHYVKTGRLKVSYKPTEDFSLHGTFQYSINKGEGGGSLAIWALDQDDPWQVPEDDSFGVGNMMKSDVRFMSYALEANWNMWDMANLTFIPTIMQTERRMENLNESTETPKLFPKDKQITVETRVSNPEDSKFDWVVGGFFWDSLNEASTTTRFQPWQSGWECEEPCLRQSDQPQASWSLFSQVTYPFTDRFRLTGGVRYTNDNKTTSYRIITTTVNDGSVPEYLFVPEVLTDSGIKDIDNSIKGATYKIGAEYDLSSDSMAYFNISTGFKPGGIGFATKYDESGTKNLDEMKYDQETSVQYELGSKNRFMNNRLQLNGSFYYTFYKGAQVTFMKTINADSDYAETVMYTKNAGTADLYGAEVEATWMVTQFDQLKLSLTTAKGVYHDLLIDADNGPCPPFFTEEQCAASQPPPRDMEGAQMPNNPKLGAVLGYDHKWDFGTYGILTTGLDFNYKSKYYLTYENWSPAAIQDSYHKTNLYAYWTSSGGKIALNAYLKNLENAAVPQFVMASQMTSADKPLGRFQPGDPRTYGASLSIKF